MKATYRLSAIVLFSCLTYACGGNVQSGDTVFVMDQPDSGQGDSVIPDAKSDTVLSVEFVGPEAKEVAPGESNVLFLSLVLTSTQNVEIQRMPLHLQAINGQLFEQGQYLHNIRLTDMASQKVVCGPVETPYMLGPNGENQQFVTDFPLSCDQPIVVKKGHPLILGLTLDVSSEHAPPVGNAYRAALEAFQDEDAKYADTGLPLPIKLIAPNVPVIGNAMTIKSGAADAGADGDAQECTTDDDCAVHNGVCLVLRCMSGSCFAFERDDDGDKASLCGGGKPGSYDCDDNDQTVNPNAPEIPDGKDNDCDGLVDENQVEDSGSDAPQTSAYYCEPWASDPEYYGYRGCCGTFVKSSAVKAGDLIKGSGYPVFYYASNGKRYLFPSSVELDSWFAPIDFTYMPIFNYGAICDNVIELTDTQLAAIPIGGNATKRPGAYVTGISTDPKRYVITAHHTLRWASPELLDQIYAGTAEERTRLTPEVFFANYFMGSSLSSNDEYLSVNEYQTADIEVELGIK